jgi:hypothetical protein
MRNGGARMRAKRMKRERAVRYNILLESASLSNDHLTNRQKGEVVG